MLGILLPPEEIIDHYEVVVKKKHVHGYKSLFNLPDSGYEFHILDSDLKGH